LCKRDFAKEAENKALMENVSVIVHEVTNEIFYNCLINLHYSCLYFQLTKLMKKMELSKPEQEAKLVELKARQEHLVKLKPNWDTKERLEKVELPELTQKKQEYEAQIRSFENTLGDLNETLSLLTMDKNSAESLRKDTTLFDKSLAEKKNFDLDVTKWDSSRDPKAKG